MNGKYPELVQYFRDKTEVSEYNQGQVQKAVHEHQYFAKVFEEIKYVMNFEPKTLDPRVVSNLDSSLRSILENPKLAEVLGQAKFEIVDSIFFHASELNQVVYNYSWKTYKEHTKEETKGGNKEEEKKSQTVYEKSSRFLGTMYEESYLYPANTIIFVLFVFVVLFMLQRLGSSVNVEFILNFVRPMVDQDGKALHYGHTPSKPE